MAVTLRVVAATRLCTVLRSTCPGAISPTGHVGLAAREKLSGELPRRDGRVRFAGALLVNGVVVAEAASEIHVLLGDARRALVRA